MNTSIAPQSTSSHEKNLATVVYALQAAAFGVGFTYFIAVAINYYKRKAVAGTWVESHFRWQINTFWYSLVWGALGGATLMWPIGYMMLFADAIWVVFRIVQGWSRLNQGKPMYTASQPTAT